MSWLVTVALLCQMSVATGGTASQMLTDRPQLRCQRELIECLQKNNYTLGSPYLPTIDKDLAKCVMDRQYQTY